MTDLAFFRGKHINKLVNFFTKKSSSKSIKLDLKKTPVAAQVKPDVTLGGHTLKKPVEINVQSTDSIAISAPISNNSHSAKINLNPAVSSNKTKTEVRTAIEKIPEIKNAHELNPNISTVQADRVKTFADEKNLLLRATGGNIPVNEGTKAVRAELKEIDSIFNKATPLEREYVAYRGLDLPTDPYRPFEIAYTNTMKNAKVGDVIKPDDAYTFVAFEKKNVLGSYAPSGLMEIRMPKGSKIVQHDGWEALLPRNSQFKVLNKTIDENNRINYVLEYIPSL